MSSEKFSGQPAGVESVSRGLQFLLKSHCVRVRVTEHAPRGLFRILERIHGLAEIIERGAVVLVERIRIIPPHSERGLGILPEDALRHGQCSAQQRLNFFEAL